MNFEDELRNGLKSLPIVQPGTVQLDEMRRRIGSARKKKHGSRRKSTLSWAGTAAALVAAAVGLYAEYIHKEDFNTGDPPKLNNSIQPADVQVSLMPDNTDIGTSTIQQGLNQPNTSQSFLIHVEKWPKNSGNHIVLVMATNHVGDHVSMQSVANVDTVRPQLNGELLSWQRAVQSALSKQHLSKVDAQSLQIVESSGRSKSGDLYVTADANHSVKVQDWRLAILDVDGPPLTAQTSPSAKYQVQWMKVVKPQVSATPAAAIQFLLGSQVSQVQTLWQTTLKGEMGVQSFGLYEYVKNGTTFVASVNGEQMAPGNWAIPGGKQAIWKTPKNHIDGVDTLGSFSGSLSQAKGYDVELGAVSDKSAVHVRLTFANGTTKTVQVKNGAFGLVRTYNGNGNQMNIVSAKAMTQTGQVIASMSIHISK